MMFRYVVNSMSPVVNISQKTTLIYLSSNSSLGMQLIGSRGVASMINTEIDCVNLS